MDSSPKPSDKRTRSQEEWDRWYQELMARKIGMTEPDNADRLSQALALLHGDAVRFRNAAADLGSLVSPTSKKMGMGVSSLLLRARNLNARYRAFEDSLGTDAEDAPEVPALTESVIEVARVGANQLQALRWPVSRSDWLEAQVRSVATGCGVITSGSQLVAVPGHNEPDWRAALQAVRSAFRSTAWDALAGEDGLLKGLPKLQEDITRLIYREEYFGSTD